MTRSTPPAHFRPMSERQRREVLRRIDAAEFAAMQATAEPGLSEGTRSVHTINEGLRTGAIRLQPEPTASSMTPDPLRLRTDARKPVLRVVQGGGDQVQGNTSPRAAYPIPQKPEPIELVHRPPSLNAFERRAVISVVAIYLVVLAGLVATTIHFRT